MFLMLFLLFLLLILLIELIKLFLLLGEEYGFLFNFEDLRSFKFLKCFIFIVIFDLLFLSGLFVRKNSCCNF